MLAFTQPEWQDPSVNPGDILLVDDVLDNLQVLSAMLEAEGYEVRQALNGHMALMGIEAELPDLILLDVMMPDMDGYAVCQQLKSHPRTAGIPILFISALDTLEDKLQAFAVGGVDYITKPFQEAEVLARVRTQLTLLQLRRHLERAHQDLLEINSFLEDRVRERTAQLRHRILFDALTGLPSRENLIGQLEESLERLRPQPEARFALLLLDCDRFGLINSSLGYALGDQMLSAIGQRLSQFAETQQGFVARFGEDDFCLLLNQISSPQEAEAQARAVLKLLRDPFQIDLYEVYLTASIGIVIGDSLYAQPQDVLRDADTALRQAKHSGRGGFHLFDPGLHTAAIQRLRLENDLRRAMERQEFHVFYQPIVNLKQGRIAAFEALIRWQHPERGWVLPTEFIPCMEETGLIIPVGLQVLQMACSQVWQWQQQLKPLWAARGVDPLVISVNLSTCQFSYPTLLEDVDRVLSRSGLDPVCLKLEITESVIVENTQAAQRLVEQLRARRIHISLDDFGTGYSSLSYLHHFPVDSVKIDRSFVKDMGPNGENAQIATAVIELGHALGMSVIAEGIDSPLQVEVLRALNCEYGQGYYFSPPLTPEQAWALLEQDPRW